MGVRALIDAVDTLSARHQTCRGVICRVRGRHLAGVVQEPPYEARNHDPSGRAPATKLHIKPEVGG